MSILYLTFILTAFFFWLIFIELLKPKYIVFIILFVIGITITNTYFFSPYKIPTASMVPTLLPGDRIIVNKYFYRNQDPTPGDIVLFELPRNPKQVFIKRLIALPNDKVEITNKTLYINDQRPHEPFALHLDSQTIPPKTQPRDFFGPITVPENYMFVLGDNRDYSSDSRFWGFLPKKCVQGKVSIIYWSWDNKKRNVRWERIGKSVK